MPDVWRFLGIVIAMYYDDHAPPHFHAKYGEYEITVETESGIVKGDSRGEGLHMSWNGTNFIGKN